jgi:hypothetical protein
MWQMATAWTGNADSFTGYLHNFVSSQRSVALIHGCWNLPQFVILSAVGCFLLCARDTPLTLDNFYCLRCLKYTTFRETELLWLMCTIKSINNNCQYNTNHFQTGIVSNPKHPFYSKHKCVVMNQPLSIVLTRTLYPNHSREVTFLPIKVNLVNY